MRKHTIILLLLISSGAIAQNIDEAKMNRDIEIANNVLATLLKGDSEMFLGGNSINGTYVQGYGVIFTIPKHNAMMFIRPPRAVIAPQIRVRTRGTGDQIIINDDKIKAFSEKTEKVARKQAELAQKQAELAKKQQELAQKNQELSEEDQKELENIQEELALNQEELQDVAIDIDIDEEALAEIAEEAESQALQWQTQFTETLDESMEKIEQAIITFLADYADLIGQLKPSDHIMVKQESPYEDFVVGWSDDTDVWGSAEDENGKRGGFSAEVSKQVISDYKTGKISFDSFKEKVVIKRAEPELKSADLDMFASIFRQYYGPKMSSTFFIENTPSYEILDNFGVIFTVSTYSSYQEGNFYYMPGMGEEKVSPEKRKSKIEELYPKFENDLKAFIVDYGRTIRSLGDNQMLVLKIRMTKCEDCSIPKSIVVSLKMSVLKQFDQQKISRDKALAAIEIKKNFESANF